MPINTPLLHFWESICNKEIIQQPERQWRNENSGHSLSNKYADAFNHDSDQSEDICYSNYETNRDNQATNHYASEDNGGRGGDIEIRNNYLNKFTDPNDERRNFNYLNPNNRILTNKFKINLATLVSFA
jgi:hypothetical protein